MSRTCYKSGTKENISIYKKLKNSQGSVQHSVSCYAGKLSRIWLPSTVTDTKILGTTHCSYHKINILSYMACQLNSEQKNKRI